MERNPKKQIGMEHPQNIFLKRILKCFLANSLVIPSGKVLFKYKHTEGRVSTVRSRYIILRYYLPCYLGLDFTIRRVKTYSGEIIILINVRFSRNRK